MYSTGLNAQEVNRSGTAGAQFLKLGVGARGAALGEALVSIPGEITGLYWNPASVSSIQKSSFAVSRNELYVDLSYNFVGFVQPLGRSNALGASIIYLDSGQMEETTISQPEGTGSYFRWEAFSVGVSYAQYITDRLRLGGTVKYIREGVFHEKAQTLAIDVGTLLDTGVLGFRLGMSVTNLGGQMKFSNPPLNPENQVNGLTSNRAF